MDSSPQILQLRTNAHGLHKLAVDAIELLRATFPAAAQLDCHRQLCDMLLKIANLLDHPMLFVAHTVLFLVRTVRYSRKWARLFKNMDTLDASFPKPQSTPPSPSVSAPSASLSTPSTSSTASTPTAFPIHPFCSPRRSLPIETRLRIRDKVHAILHEKRMVYVLPPDVPKPDLSWAEFTPFPSLIRQRPTSAPADRSSLASDFALLDHLATSELATPEHPPLSTSSHASHSSHPSQRDSFTRRIRIGAQPTRSLSTSSLPSDNRPTGSLATGQLSSPLQPQVSSLRPPISSLQPVRSPYTSQPLWADIVDRLQLQLLDNLTRAVADLLEAKTRLSRSVPSPDAPGDNSPVPREKPLLTDAEMQNLVAKIEADYASWQEAGLDPLNWDDEPPTDSRPP